MLALVARQEARIEQLLEIVAQQEKRIAALEAEVARLRKDSSNSSKPPSSDIVKPPKSPAGKGSGKIGGQPGHPRHEREPFGPDDIDRVEKLDLARCPDCGGRMKRAAVAPRMLQRIELVQMPVEVVEYQSGGFLCRRCGRIHYAPPPAGGLFGPKLTALVAYLKGACHASFSTIRKYFRDVIGVTI